MSGYDPYLEKYDEYEDLFDPMQTDRQARRKRKPKAVHVPKKSTHEVVEEIADATGLEGGFNTTYVPGLFEEGWLLQSLRSFYDQQLITDVLARIKGGKEASVYRCAAGPNRGMELVAAKVYRPRTMRNLRNDKMYREGRAVLKENGKAVKNNDHRVMRALNKKTGFGDQVAHTSWLMYEFTTLQTLHAAGAAVPKPYAVNENSIIMGYCGDEHSAAHTLNEVRLEADEARRLFYEVLDNIELMLQHDLVHGDLSAYNILYWEGAITIIDFPQVVNPHTSSHAQMIFQRDVTRVCEYFASQGVESDPQGIARRLWKRYAGRDPEEIAADMSVYTDGSSD
jgi:RIO kinase 1